MTSVGFNGSRINQCSSPILCMPSGHENAHSGSRNSECRWRMVLNTHISPWDQTNVDNRWFIGWDKAAFREEWRVVERFQPDKQAARFDDYCRTHWTSGGWLDIVRDWMCKRCDKKCKVWPLSMSSKLSLSLLSARNLETERLIEEIYIFHSGPVGGWFPWLISADEIREQKSPGPSHQGYWQRY